MRNATSLRQAILVATILAGSLTGFSAVSEARLHKPLIGQTLRHGGAKLAFAGRAGRRNAKYVFAKGSKARYAHASYGGLQCVPFARAASGIELKGNAADWWDAAAGVYERGAQPEAGSVLNFRSTGRMRLGHVAVVTAVLDARHIEVEQANWAKGSVSRNTPVEDVSPDNDWTAVRVAIGGGNFGSTYPTYGFIYDRPDSGTMLANARSTPSVTATATVRDAGYIEVAEAPVAMHHRRVLTIRRRGAEIRSASAHRVTVSHRLILDISDRQIR